IQDLKEENEEFKRKSISNKNRIHNLQKKISEYKTARFEKTHIPVYISIATQVNLNHIKQDNLENMDNKIPNNIPKDAECYPPLTTR
ncbi:hypothetical protein A3Q56_06484, partial [Intoshia linei]